MGAIKRKIRVLLPLRLFALCLAAIVVVLVLISRTTISNASAVEVDGVGVYWERDCQNQVSAINWDTLRPGMTEKLTVYVRNEWNELAVLSLRTGNWEPTVASEFMTLSWTYMGQTVEPQEVVKLEFILAVSPEIEGITNFLFDIMIQVNEGSGHLLGDVNGDGFVGGYDTTALAVAWWSSIGDSNYNPLADFNGDGFIGGYDATILAIYWWTSVP